ncbi:membrane protein [SAR11 cluster bacterium PRT-SC02]|nr:membrane protein [SAR11 cluster bacterium PRT-SC02]KPU82145.1 membrane protein [SAR11 cluster bacterium PRT-SC02]KPU82169.1 membrane protein [SAR11 cluster bacterium PRT-SC02]KPU82234.1 membrane protein [SAR11 cluster bacterium PRT-SC02]
MDKFKNWMIESANIMFDDSKNDLRALPKSVRLQILIVLSFIWSTVFSLYVFSLTTFIWGWAGVVLAHIGLIIAVYITFKFFHKAEKEKKSVFETGNYNPAKIFIVFFLVFFIFIFTKGIEVLTKSNSYPIKYDGPEKSTLQRIKDFVK